MNLYLIYQNENNDYNTYDSAVVSANTSEDAKYMYPNDMFVYDRESNLLKYADGTKVKGGVIYDYSWASPENVNVEFIGIAVPGTHSGVICASFNAG